MKKKIGELTLRQVNKLCKNQRENKGCIDCPLSENNIFPCSINIQQEKFLNKEIEVEEND